MDPEHDARLASIHKDQVSQCTCDRCRFINTLERKVKNKEKLTKEDLDKFYELFPPYEV